MGYYINVAYVDDALVQRPPPVIEVSRLGRNVLVHRPLLTPRVIPWDDIPVRGEGDDSNSIVK